jgi:pimeloyl-ACP methyl ester carboxylesterase
VTEPINLLDVGSGPPLVLIHGDFNDGPGAWSRQIASLAAHHRLLVVDRRGHGASPREPRPYTIAGDADDILDAVNRAGVDRFHLAGHSYGGLVAIEIARKAARRVRSLHLIEPPYLALLPDDPEISRLIDCGLEIQRHAAEWGAERTAEAFFSMLAGEQAVQKMQTSPGWPSVVNEATRISDAEYPSLYPATAIEDLQLSVPVKVYSGGRSHAGLQAVAARIAELIPLAEYVVIPNGTHAVQYTGEPFDRELLAVTSQA